MGRLDSTKSLYPGADGNGGIFRENVEEATALLKALAHEARLVILCLLVGGEKSVSDLEKILKIRQPAVSQQLARLRADDLVAARRQGKNIFYTIARPEVRDIINSLSHAFRGDDAPSRTTRAKASMRPAAQRAAGRRGS
jgi:DNA-binding transcriptional ArsR family regulator